MKCGLSVEQFLNLSWYEAGLIAEQHEYREQTSWLHTRTIVSALTGEAPTKIIQLPLFDKKQLVKAPTREEQQRIIAKYQHLLKPHGK